MCFFFQAEDGIRYHCVTGVQTCALPIYGYVNSRVAKVDRNGKWLKSWGSKGAKPGEFNTPHSIAADAKGNIYVADRGNRRIQVFDGEGTFQRELTIDGPYDGRARPGHGHLA